MIKMESPSLQFALAPLAPPPCVVARQDWPPPPPPVRHGAASLFFELGWPGLSPKGIVLLSVRSVRIEISWIEGAMEGIKSYVSQNFS
jgi:hypothetical protein